MKEFKLIVNTEKCREVDGVMNDPAKLEETEKRIVKETEKVFEKFRQNRIKALSKAAREFLD